MSFLQMHIEAEFREFSKFWFQKKSFVAGLNWKYFQSKLQKLSEEFNLAIYITNQERLKLGLLCVSISIGDSNVGDIVMLVTLWWLYDWFEMLVAESLCWRLFSLCWWFSQCIKSVTNISNLSPTHLVFIIRHQHRCNYLVLNLDLLRA